MKTRLLTAAALLTIAPGVALADSRTYTAIYSPELDVATRSCEIINTGVQGGLAGDVANLNTLTNSANTSIMRTIGATAGTAQSKAGIRFDLIGASVLKIEEADMTDLQGGDVRHNGNIVLKVPRAKIGMRNSTASDIGDLLGITSPKNDSTVAEVTFKDGKVGQGRDSGSIVVGAKTDIEVVGTGANALRTLASERVSGGRAGTIEFTLRGADAINETVVMKATISCEPVPVQREAAGAFITAIN